MLTVLAILVAFADVTQPGTESVHKALDVGVGNLLIT
jgi:hypothetical protein